MEKGYYLLKVLKEQDKKSSQSTIKMEKGYYIRIAKTNKKQPNVAIHNKNGKGLLPWLLTMSSRFLTTVAIHNKNGQGLLQQGFIFDYQMVPVSRNPQ